MPAAPRVAAVVCNYNGKKITLQAVASLLQMTYRPCDVVVVDNGSTDGSAAALAAAFPDLRQLRVEVNRGSSEGYRVGFCWAFENGYDYVLLLNNDIEVDPEMLTELVRLAESDPAIGVVGPKCYFHGDRHRIWSAGGKLRFREAITSERGHFEIDRGQYDRDQEVDYINGCAILVRRQAAEAAGTWDPIYFTCVDDADFCTRASRAGFRCFYAHRARLWHRVAVTLGGYVPTRTFHGARSTAVFVRRYARPWQRLTYAAFTAAALPAAYLRELWRGNQKAVVAKLRGVVEGWRMELHPPPRLRPGQPVALPSADAAAASWGGRKTRPSSLSGGLGS